MDGCFEVEEEERQQASTPTPTAGERMETSRGILGGARNRLPEARGRLSAVGFASRCVFSYGKGRKNWRWIRITVLGICDE